jgi:hypothetical protein
MAANFAKLPEMRRRGARRSKLVADTAARWHVHQRRKGAGEEPYS